jgi:spermidine/putrescine transport system ATP-binding protein
MPPTANSAGPAVKAKPVLDLVNVCRTFEGFDAVSSVTLPVMEHEFFTIVGPSGSGKTTLLRMIAGMDKPTDGDITLRGVSIVNLPPNKRPTCMVFQSLALFPHMTVGQNIEFPLKMRRVSDHQRRSRALELLQMVQLPEEYYAKSVMKCSGGERQRVALARAFAYDPEILLFDEPLSAIDAKLRKSLEKEVKELHAKTGKTFIYITHSLEEAMVMSDRIGVMQRGAMVQVGTPEDIYTKPVNRFVAEFVGDTNVLSVKADGTGTWKIDGLPNRYRIANNKEVLEGFIVVRPEFANFLEKETDAENAVRGVIRNEYSLGSRVQYHVKVGKTLTFIVEQPRSALRMVSESGEVIIGWNAADAVFVKE